MKKPSNESNYIEKIELSEEQKKLIKKINKRVGYLDEKSNNYINKDKFFENIIGENIKDSIDLSQLFRTHYKNTKYIESELKVIKNSDNNLLVINTISKNKHYLNFMDTYNKLNKFLDNVLSYNSKILKDTALEINNEILENGPSKKRIKKYNDVTKKLKHLLDESYLKIYSEINDLKLLEDLGSNYDKSISLKYTSKQRLIFLIITIIFSALISGLILLLIN